MQIDFNYIIPGRDPNGFDGRPSETVWPIIRQGVPGGPVEVEMDYYRDDLNRVTRHFKDSDKYIIRTVERR